MDLMRLLRSIEEFIYEVMTWLVFFPRTLWRTVRHPMTMMQYSDLEQSDDPDEQYVDAVNPVLFLMLSLMLVHAIELGANVGMTPQDRALLPTLLSPIFSSNLNLLVARCIVFGLFPLMYATTLLRRRGVKLDRNTLRTPFFAQCYAAAVLALTVNLGEISLRTGDPPARPAGAALMAVAVVWYVSVQSAWLREHLNLGYGRAAALAAWTFAKAVLMIAGVTLVAIWPQIKAQL